VFFKLGYDLPTILKKIKELYPTDGPSEPTIRKYYKSLSTSSLTLIDPIPSGPLIKPEKIQAVAQVVGSNRYAGLREIASLAKTNKDTVRKILHTKLKLVKRNLKWIPHRLTDAQKLSRVTIARELLVTLKNDEKNDFIHILTGDETWLYYSYPHESMWTRSGVVEERERRTIGTKKIMLNVFWGVETTALFELLPEGESMTAKSFSSIVVEPLTEYKSLMIGDDDELLVHMDNAPCHKAKTTRDQLKDAKIIILPQPPYSPDLAPSDFFLFGFLKQRLKGKECSTSKEILKEAEKVMDSIPRRTRLRVFHEWIWRLQTVVENGGEYY
jgi:histone-lysine N-methyltransferase SETMAR